MQNNVENNSAFGSFRALDGDGDVAEREQLFQNMARLFSAVCDRCTDNQVEQYDDVLSQLADMVEVEGRIEVAKMLAPLERAPGTVVVKLANDTIEVARPLLEFSSVLSDDDLIEIVGGKGEEHRVVIAGRQEVAERVGDAIVDHGGLASVERLVCNEQAELGDATLVKLVEKAAHEPAMIENLRGRRSIDWQKLDTKLDAASGAVLKKLQESELPADEHMLGQAQDMVANRLRNKAGFNASSWRIAWNQVKALGDRKQLDRNSLNRYARFEYGHHFGAAMASMLGLKQQVFVKWLAAQDYRAVIVAARTLGLNAGQFEAGMRILPWRSEPDEEEIENAVLRFETLSEEEANDIFGLWRRHENRGRDQSVQQDMAVGM